MLRVKVDQKEFHNRLYCPKNNSFKYKWRILDDFNTSLDRHKFHIQLMCGEQGAALYNQQVLQQYKGRFNYRRETQAIAKLALAGNSTDPVLAVKSFRTEVRRQQAVVNVENEVKFSALQHVHSISLPRQEIKVHLITFGGIAAAQVR